MYCIYIYIYYIISSKSPWKFQIAIATPPHRRAVSTMAFTMKPRGFQSALPRVVVTKVPETTGSFDHFGRFGCVYSDFDLFFCTHFRWNWEAFHSFLMFKTCKLRRFGWQSAQRAIRCSDPANGGHFWAAGYHETSTVGYHERRGIMEKMMGK